MEALEYDYAVIGSGPAGQKAAICAAKLGKKVAMVERKGSLGGACVQTGTIPSKTMREAVMHLSGYLERAHYGESYSVKRDITAQDLLARCHHVIDNEVDVIRHQLQRNRIDLYDGTASFIDAHALEVETKDNPMCIRAKHILIAVGTRPFAPPGVDIDNKVILDSDGILSMDSLPRSLVVIGGGVIGCEYASMFATLGVRVTIVEQKDRLMPFLDREIVDALVYHMRQHRVTLRLGESVAAATQRDGQVIIELKSGKRITADKALYSAGRQGQTAKLDLDKAGVASDARGRIAVNAQYQTSMPHIYAVGDVIGFPSLASTAMEQGRMAANHAFGGEAHSFPALFPYGVYTIPEISMVGATEEELTEKAVPYEIGIANYREIARGQIIGDETGLLKLLFHRDTHVILGVHIIGAQASELIHIGQAVMAFKGTLDYFVQCVFNYPTLAECYKVAALDGMNRIRR